MSQTEHYIANVSLPVSAEEAFAYHDRPGALKRLIPPWESVTIEKSDESLAPGSRVVLKTRIGGIPVRWIAEHTDYDPPRLFVDKQLSGPFAAWTHRHEFSENDGRSILCDRIEYELPLGAVGQGLGSGLALSMIESMFAYRHRVTRDDLTLHAQRRQSPMSIAISGSTGLVGDRLAGMLGLLGHRVRPIVRSPDDDPQSIAAWESEKESEKLGEVDAVVHLAGKPIASQRWTEDVKQQIMDSRVEKTRELCRSLAGLARKPSVLVCASATGIYGDRGDEVLDEKSAAGSGFLADVARQWEEACQPAIESGIRVVHARFAMVLSPRGGALQKMLLPAKLAGGALGSGNQWWSWIELDDVAGALYHAITVPEIRGPVNFAAPSPMTNAEFAKKLAGVLHRPALVPAPAMMVRAALGEMADELLLASARVRPGRLMETGYRFRFDDLTAALRYCLGYERLESIE